MPTLRHVLAVIQEGIAIFDAEDRLVECNDQCRSHFNYMKELWVPGATFESLVRGSFARGQHVLDGESSEAKIQERLEAHRTTRYEFEHHLVDGRCLRIKEHRTEDGHTITTYVDVTNLAQREEDLRLILDGVADGVLTLDENNRIESLNPAAVQIFGHRPIDMVGRELNEFLPDAFDRPAPDVGARLDNPASAQTVREVRGYHRDGRALTLELTISEMRRRGRKMAVSIVRDIGARKKAEQELRDSQERFRRLSDAAPQGIAIHDRGVFTEANGRLGAKDGKEALDFLGEFDEGVDLIICDWNMPRMTGLELLRQLRTADPDTPFLMVTGIADRDSVVAAKSAGVTGYVIKPYSSIQLSKKISAVRRFVHARNQ